MYVNKILAPGGIFSMSDTQVFVALAVALIPGLLALRLSTELYK